MQRIIFNIGLKLETFLVTFLLIFASCAQIVTPNGGKSDSTPPKSKSINPPNNSVNFKSRRIEFVFDEFIQLKDPQKQILISPPLKNFPDLKVEFTPEHRTGFKETHYLRLSWEKAKKLLNWSPQLSLEESVSWTLDWYREFYKNGNCIDLTLSQIRNYESRMERP